MAKADNKLKITPRARKLAGENKLALQNIKIIATGYEGGICEKDVLEYLKNRKPRVSSLANKIALAENIDLEKITGTGINGKIMKRDVFTIEEKREKVETNAREEKQQFEESKFSDDGKEILEVIPYAGIRKIIGEKLAKSKFTAPHLYFTQKVNLDKLLLLRGEVNTAQDRKTSVTDYIAKAVVQTLEKYPEMNASLIDGNIVSYKTVNLGIAVAAPTGLIVPAVKNAEKMSVVEISKTSGVLFDKARNGKLTPDEYTGGTFTISNLGMFGIENFTAIINPPELGILAISSTKDEPLVVTDGNGNKTIEIKPMMNINLTVDHRVIDGLLAAQFVTEIKKKLESPIGLLV